MSELDEAAVEAAVKAYDIARTTCGRNEGEHLIDLIDRSGREAMRAAIAAYLAARPMPDAAAMEREVIEPSDECPLSERVDGKLHTWCFDGDDPYVFCHWCGEYRDALTSRVIRPGRKAVRS